MAENKKKGTGYLLAALCSTIIASSPAIAVDLTASDDATDALINMSIESIVNIKGISVSEHRKEESSSSKSIERVAEATAAVYTVTAEDIQRFGFTSIPEAIRMVPGAQVARVGANHWAVSLRGFTDLYTDKLLVLIDGRTIFSSVFSGVYWDMHELPMEDIARIEVVKGPGGTLWGANAVNGIINIITKKSRATQGKMASVSGGWGDDRAVGSLRYGGEVKGKEAHYRVYAKQRRRDDSTQYRHPNEWYKKEKGTKTYDSSEISQAGFRSDWRIDQAKTLLLHGDYEYGVLNNIVDNPSLLRYATAPAQAAVLANPGGGYTPYSDIPSIYATETTSAANLVARLENQVSETANSSIQVYFDRAHRNHKHYEVAINTYDFEFQYGFSKGKKQYITWGTGVRYITDSLEPSSYFNLDPANKSYLVWNAFVQDRIQIIPNKLALTLGSKIEHNDFTGVEYQPNIRLGYTPSETKTIWAAVSRAVRSANRLDTGANIKIMGLPSGPLTLNKNPDQQSEQLRAYEIGFRAYPKTNLSYDIAAFYNKYDKLRSTQIVNITVTPPGYNVKYVNSGQGYSYGGEFSLKYAPTEKWDIKFNYSHVNQNIQNEINVNNGKRSPAHQFNLSSFWQLPKNFEIGSILYYVDNLSGYRASNSTIEPTAPTVKDYYRFDTRLGYKPKNGVTLSLVGQNLFDDKHMEFIDQNNATKRKAEISRSFYLNMLLEF